MIQKNSKLLRDYHLCIYIVYVWYSGGSVAKNPPANSGDKGSNLGSGRSLSEGNCNLFQYSCLGNPMDKGVWWVTVHGVCCKRNQHDLTTEQQHVVLGQD